MGFAGGFTLGVVQAGFQLVAKREMKGGFGVPNCEANRHLLGSDWKAEACHESEWTVPAGGADLVFGNPPCSGFSVMSAKEFRGANSKINACMWAFVEYVARVMPTIAVFESVQMARTRPDGHDLMRRLRAHLENLTDQRWALHHVRHNALAVGGAGQRRRYFWVASRVPFGVDRYPLRRVPTLNEVIQDLDGLALTWSEQPYRRPATWWSEERRSPSGAVDGHVAIKNPLTRRIDDLIKTVGWPDGRSIADVARTYYEKYGNLPDSFAATAERIVANDFNMGFTTPIRWTGTNPARVITGGSLLTAIHPFLDRTLTHREAARIMGFPDDWRLWPLRNQSGLMLTHGKGITVDCGRWIAKWVRHSLDGEPGPITGDEIGEREYDIDLTHAYRDLVGSTGKR
jgi:site-specific DNA-cytosine methylase